jgi:hypothetical protein
MIETGVEGGLRGECSKRGKGKNGANGLEVATEWSFETTTSGEPTTPLSLSHPPPRASRRPVG